MIENGVTGIVVDDLAGMIDAVEVVARLDPWVMRTEAERRFSPERMLAGYLAVYEQACAKPFRRAA